MDEEGKKMMKDTVSVYKKIFKSLLYTLIIFFISNWGVSGAIGLALGEMTAEQSNTWGLMSLGVGIIFTIIYCTFTILDGLKNIK